MGSPFTLRVWAFFMENLGLTISFTSGYHPQPSGQVKRANREIGQLLRAYCLENQGDWARSCGWSMPKTLRHSANELNPFQCLVGYQPPPFPWNATPTDALAINWHCEQVWEITYQCLRQVADMQRRYYSTMPP